MNCIEFEAALAGQADARIPLSPDALKHAAVCPDCSQQLRLNRQLDVAVQAWRPVTDLPDLTDRVLLELQTSTDDSFTPNLVVGNAGRQRLRPTSTGRGRMTLVASFAACMVVAVIGLTLSSQQASTIADRTADAPSEKRETVATSLDVSSTLSEVISDLGTEYQEIARETSLAAKDLALVLPQSHENPARPETEEESGQQSAVTDAARILRPISSRVETALGFIWQAIPTEVPSG